MWDLTSLGLFYFCIVAVSALVVLLLFQWIGQLRSRDTAYKFTVPLSAGFNKLLTWPRNWSDSRKVLGGIALAVLLSRLLIFSLGAIWSLYFTDGHTLDFNAIWQKWDAYHYLFIAQNGYVTTPHDKAVLVAFYPLYPLLIKIFSFIFGSYLFAAYFVSVGSLMASSFFLYKLVAEQISPSVGANAVLFLLISPFSVFFGLVFNESLFLGLVLAFFYALTKRRWLMAGFMGLLAALTKNQGILLIIPFLMEAMAVLFHERRYGKFALSQSLKTLFPVLLIPAGFFIYLLINYVIFGDPFQFLVFQKVHWHNSFGFFAKNMENLWRQVPSYPDPAYRFSVMMLQPIIFVVTLTLLVVAIAKKIPSSINAFSLIFLLISFSPTWLLSGARYSTTLFFIPMLLAILSTTTMRLILLCNLSVCLMTLFVIVYVEGAIL